MRRRMLLIGSSLLLALLAVSSPVAAQITTGTVTGTVKDSQGGVIPGATVVLISETRGTRSAPAITNETGTYVFPNVTADTYTVEVSLESFKAVKREGVAVSGGDRVGLPAMTLEPGALAETVTVTAASPLVQTQSGERSYAVKSEQIENLPFARNNFTTLTAFTPGVVQTGASAGATRLGGAGQNNIMMDGISAMDTGNNGQMLNMNVDAIGEVKILTQGYQAEYGRSSGLQITAVTKSGTNQFRGSAYDIQTNSDWDSNSWVNEKNGDPKPKQSTKTLGYTIGGPIGKPGGNNKLFFFYSHEYRPVTTAINNGNPIRIRVPTAAERAGDFSQTLDNNGALFNLIHDPLSPLPCVTGNTAGCFQDGGVLGKIPANRLYPIGQQILGRYPLPNVNQLPGQNYNYQVDAPTTDNLTQQPAIRVDYQLSQKLRFTGKYNGQRARKLITPGAIQGFSDVQNPYPFITNYGATVDYQLNNSTFLEGTYGFIRNQLAGGGAVGGILTGGILVNDSANRLTSLPGFPLLYPNAGAVDSRYYAYGVLNDLNPVWFDGTKITLPPAFGWGTRIMGTAGVGALPGPPNQLFPGFLNINRTQDVAISLTKVWGPHTSKAGFYNNHSFKAQNTGAGGVANLGFQGYVNFGNDTNNALDTGFGFANAATGVFTQYLQQSSLIEGSMIYNNTEFYLQDNWKVNGKMTLDYGLRFTHQSPQYDQFLQMSNFFADQWSLANAPLLYIAGCSNGATVCSGNARNAVDPRTGQIVTAPGAANSAALIGTVVPGTGNPTDGIHKAGDGIADTSYTWPALVVAPRFGIAYDLKGDSTFVLRGGGGLFFDRPDGNTVFSIPGNPPISTSQDLRNGQLQTLGTGLSSQGVPALITFQYNAGIPSSWQWQGGVQMALPWNAALDVSYVGNHGFNRLRVFQGGANGSVDLNAVDFGAAYLPQNQDPTLGTSTVPGATAYPANMLRAFRGYSNINEQETRYWDEYHGLQFSLNRRFTRGLAFGANYNLGLSFKGNTGIGGNTGLQLRLQHAADGTISVRPDQAAYEKLNENLALQRHVVKAFAVWNIPDAPSSMGSVAKAILSDWQLSGVLTAGSAYQPGAIQANGAAQTNPTNTANGRYDINYTYQNNGTNTNLTGSPDYAAKIVYVGDPGSGCSSDQYRQFNTAAVAGPTYGSVGLESGRFVLGACPDHTVDMAIARNIRVGGNRNLQFRLDVFNVFNAVIYNDRNSTVIYRSPTDQTVVNSQFLPDGSLDPNRLTPRTAGFGAATNAQPLRNLQLQIRFGF
ncbi:MAG TPA: carboxypeptidase-like regulatory domain-containing protein [Vicinamibacterales bacterium]|nr:carboxypeptidase-like regulatory domain-containing protein [Vicinamibacterales bacterium]